MFYRPQKDRRREVLSTINGTPRACAGFGERGDVANISRRIADALAKTSRGYFRRSRPPCPPASRFARSARRLLAGEGHAAAAYAWCHREWAPPRCYRRDRRHSRMHKRGRPDPSPRSERRRALKLGDALFKHGICRIADAAISIAFDFKVEQCGCVIRAIKFISDGLIDRNATAFVVGSLSKPPCTAIVSLRIHAPFSKVSRSARPRRRQRRSFECAAAFAYGLGLSINSDARDCERMRVITLTE